MTVAKGKGAQIFNHSLKNSSPVLSVEGKTGRKSGEEETTRR